MSYQARLQRMAEKRLIHQKKINGTGNYIFENRTKSDLILPKPTNEGKKVVRSGERFTGDNYFFQCVPSLLSYVGEVDMEKKILLTEQPPVYTENGKVEYVSVNDEQKLVEQTTKEKAKSKLIVEPSDDSIFIAR
jgi:hypothetical protein